MKPSNGSRVAPLDNCLRGPRPHYARVNGPETTPSVGGSGGTVTLPPAGRRAQMERWGVAREYTGARTRHQNGRTLHDGTPPLRRVRMGRNVAASDRGFLMGDGWHEVAPTHARGEGMTAHRGVLHPDEYVDRDALRDCVAAHLGFTVEEIRSVYRQGRMSDEGRALRARIDARLLEVAEAGGSMLELARALGWTIRSGGRGDKCATMENAMARAREARLGVAA